MPKPRPLRTAAERESRRIRIVAAIQTGFSYDEIARDEAISHERVRQIVVETMRRNDEYVHDHRFVQAARLEPALKLTLRKVADGKLEAVDRLVKILDRLDKYLVGAQVAIDEPDIREKLMRRVEMAARRFESQQNQASEGEDPLAPPYNPLKMNKTAKRCLGQARPSRGSGEASIAGETSLERSAIRQDLHRRRRLDL